ncbi:DUF58 domain-containing protein [Thauera sp.]|jgi:uncharacterized protein (DUF58 family)|uniref:DUF58 domain-containing protein n=1 Tax=Thauera sp. TaxID=1905334 RepID=UPI002A362B19|nr:DUF58 domain-containing protein [Thauera sp.]MDX9884935.1 DUF58 domain-containing protein [Thauera sp.]
MRLGASFADALRQGADRWLFRVGAPETAPIRLTQRRIYVLPTAAGLGFAIALVVMLVTSINYNLSLGYALVFLLGGAATASIVHAFRNLLGLSLRPGRCEPVFAGEAAGFRLQIDNARDSRRPALRLRARGQSSAFELEPATESTVLLACPTVRRGRLSIGRMVIETTWPLGLIRAWTVFVPEADCIVHPTPEPDPPPLPEDGAGGVGTGASVRDGDDDFAGLRAHRSADSPRHVAWKALARGGPMLTKQYAATRGGDVLLDWSALPVHLDVEQRLSRLSAWILRAEQDGRRYGLLLAQTSLAPSLGRDHRDRCLRELALFGSDPRDSGRQT